MFLHPQRKCIVAFKEMWSIKKLKCFSMLKVWDWAWHRSTCVSVYDYQCAPTSAWVVYSLPSLFLASVNGLVMLKAASCEQARATLSCLCIFSPTFDPIRFVVKRVIQAVAVLPVATCDLQHSPQTPRGLPGFMNAKSTSGRGNIQSWRIIRRPSQQYVLGERGQDTKTQHTQ